MLYIYKIMKKTQLASMNLFCRKPFGYKNVMKILFKNKHYELHYIIPKTTQVIKHTLQVRID